MLLPQLYNIPFLLIIKYNVVGLQPLSAESAKAQQQTIF